jgi:hypothetical protein
MPATDCHYPGGQQPWAGWAAIFSYCCLRPYPENGEAKQSACPVSVAFSRQGFSSRWRLALQVERDRHRCLACRVVLVLARQAVCVLPSGLFLRCGAWCAWQVGAMEGMQGQPVAKNMKNAMRVLGVAMIPLTMSFEKVSHHAPPAPPPAILSLACCMSWCARSARTGGDSSVTRAWVCRCRSRVPGWLATRLTTG